MTSSFEKIAKYRAYDLSCAFADLTGIGTLYSVGSDWAHIAGLKRLDFATKNCLTANQIVRDYIISAKISLIGRLSYLSSLALLVGGIYTRSRNFAALGAVGAGAFAIASLLKAGYHSTDSSFAHRDIQQVNQAIGKGCQ